MFLGFLQTWKENLTKEDKGKNKIFEEEEKEPSASGEWQALETRGTTHHF